MATPPKKPAGTKTPARRKPAARKTAPKATAAAGDVAATPPSKTRTAAKAAPRTPAQKAKDDADVTKPNPVARKAERMAMLDAKLLDDRTLGDLTAKAARESRKERR